MAWILFVIILGIGLLNLLVTRALVRDDGRRGVKPSRRNKKEVSR